MTGVEGARGRRRDGAAGLQQEEASRVQAGRHGRKTSGASAGRTAAVRAIGRADHDRVAGVDVVVAPCARAQHDPATSEPAELIGVGSAFDGTEWHFYAVNVEPMPGLEWDATQRFHWDAAHRSDRDEVRLGVR